MIGNVFYNMLTQIGNKEHDQKFIEMANSVKNLMQTKQYDSITGMKAPLMKQGVLNLLKVVDLSLEDQASLVKMGFGDLL